MLFFDRYHLRETLCFSGIEVIRNAGVIKQKRQNGKKKKKIEKETSYNIKDHKNDCLTDAVTRLKLVMKNK